MQESKVLSIINENSWEMFIEFQLLAIEPTNFMPNWAYIDLMQCINAANIPNKQQEPTRTSRSKHPK